MKFKLPALFAFLLFAYTANAQSLFELKYHFEIKKGREDYKAFMLRNEDGTGIMRIEYFDLQTKTRNIVETDMVESYGIDEKGNADSNMLIYVGLDQRMILGNVLYQPDNFVFELNKQTHYFEPSFVISFAENGKEDIGILDEVRLLQQTDLTKELVLQYFTEKDEFYINLFETEVRALTPMERKTQLHLILVANTEDRKIGKTCAIDKESTHKLYNEIADYLGIHFNPIVIAGKDFSKLNVERAINELRPGTEDIVIFYYSGHGFNDLKNNTKYPFLDLRDKASQKYGDPYTMNIESIYQQLKRKGARMNLVFGDCCNNDPSQSSNISGEAASTRVSSIGWNMDNCRALFMNNKKLSMLLAAASKGQLSAGNAADGGFFTFNFSESLEKAMGPFSNNVSWPGLLSVAQKQTIERAKRTACRQPDESVKRCEQTPLYNIE